MPDSSWRELSDDARAREYSPSSCLEGDIQIELLAYAEQSAKASKHCISINGPFAEVRYGPSPTQTIDLFVPKSAPKSTPLVVYLHGGYWQELSKEHSLFPADDCNENNIAFAAVGYTLAPSASIDEIVDECRTAVATLRDSAHSYNIDRNRIVVCGSSAGAHLAAMVGMGAEDGWRPAAVGLVSGIFELEPLIGTYVNDALNLTIESARRNSPRSHYLGDFPPSVIAFGENETSEFKRQSSDMAEALRATGSAVDLLEIEDRNHFDVVLDLCRTGSNLGEAMLNLVQRTQIH